MLWGGRFQQALDRTAFKFSSSFSFDQRLLEVEIEVNKAHVEMLFNIGVLSEDELQNIICGLNEIKEDYAGTELRFDNEYEDIHSFVEHKLKEKIGNTALKIHSGRSRNDLVATSLKLWIRRSSENLVNELRELQNSILSVAEKNVDTLIPSYTHLQRAQPISLSFHLISHLYKLERDIERIQFVISQISTSPLGSGAIAGSTLNLDRNETSAKLLFGYPAENATDAINQRDYVMDFLHTCTMGMIHLSSISEELILWSTKEWNFVTISDRFTTGSSLMPQKKNPDIAELIRGKSGRAIGNYTTVAAVLKALPFGYNRDLQEDKEALFDSFDTYHSSVILMAGMMKELTFNRDRFLDELKSDFVLSTDLADWLVLHNMPFRLAHEVVGKIVVDCIESKKTFPDLTLDDLKKYSEIFTKEALEFLQLNGSLGRKKTSGSPNPQMVGIELSKWKTKLDSWKK